METRTGFALPLVFIIVFCAAATSVDAVACTEGSACAGVTKNVTTGNFTWCCPAPQSMVPNIEYYSPTNQTCECITEEQNQANLQQKIITWANNSKGQGRMCNEGNACIGAPTFSTINDKFHFCCLSDVADAYTSSHISIYNGDDQQYIGCRCDNTTLPIHPVPLSYIYIVPQTEQYNSTGENCSYNMMCHDYPRLSCHDPSSRTTMCCYGSRGMHFQTEGATTKCTCTNELYLVQCPASIKPIPGEEPGKVEECSKGSPCFTYENGVVPDNVKESDPAYFCCLDRTFTRSGVQLSNGTRFCQCVQDLELESKIITWADSTKDQGRMCTSGVEECEGAPSKGYSNYRKAFTNCCWNTTGIYPSSTIFDGDKLEYVGCRCHGSALPVHNPEAYIVPGAVTRYNSTGENCSYNSGCNDHPNLKCQSSSVTFCCYGSRGMITTNVRYLDDPYTGCTCTNELFGSSCEANPFPTSCAACSYFWVTGLMGVLMTVLAFMG